MELPRSADIKSTLTRRCAALGVPVSGGFELTPRCNLRCKMCYVRLTPEQMAPVGRELTAREWIRLAQDAKNAGMMFLLLTGGEPTLRQDFCEIYEALAGMGFSITINTNGTLLTENIRSLWSRLPPAQVNVTLYGSSAEDYAALCGDASAFDRTVDALRWLKGQGILTHINTTMTPINGGKWMELEEFARNIGLELRMTAYCFPPVRRSACGSCEDFFRLSPEAAAELTVMDTYFREGGEMLRRRAASLSAPPDIRCGVEEGEPVSCMAGRAQFWVTWNGEMTPCGMLDHPRSDIRVDSFAVAWDALRQQVSNIRLCPECLSCEDRQTCMNCVAVTMAETGRFDGKPEYMCAMNRAYRKKLKELAQKL